MTGLIITIALLLLGYFAGRSAENRHYRSIIEREKQLVNLPTTNNKRPIMPVSDGAQSRMVVGSVVISIDYFKRFLASLRAIFGGNVRAYETLVDRARREAILRMKESCSDADEICNLRIVTSSISQGRKNQLGTVEVLASGTAIYNQ